MSKDQSQNERRVADNAPANETPPHFPTMSTLPDDCCVFPSGRRDRSVPRPDAKSVGTFGRKRRKVYRKADMSELKSATAWRREGFSVLGSAEPIDTWHCKMGEYTQRSVYFFCIR